jgi:hypothetical protein
MSEPFPTTAGLQPHLYSLQQASMWEIPTFDPVLKEFSEIYNLVIEYEESNRSRFQ